MQTPEQLDQAALAQRFDWLSVDIEQFLYYGQGKDRASIRPGQLLCEIGIELRDAKASKRAGYDLMSKARCELWRLGWQRVPGQEGYRRPGGASGPPRGEASCQVEQLLRDHLSIRQAPLHSLSSLLAQLHLPQDHSFAETAARRVLLQCGWTRRFYTFPHRKAVEVFEPPFHGRCKRALRQPIVDASARRRITREANNGRTFDPVSAGRRGKGSDGQGTRST
ncbi:MAG: hypothetical protein KF891_03995 [Rhizobacter sp.]|nr:hypothetical protein [Rhizobacter sp.]